MCTRTLPVFMCMLMQNLIRVLAHRQPCQRTRLTTSVDRLFRLVVQYLQQQLTVADTSKTTFR